MYFIVPRIVVVFVNRHKSARVYDWLDGFPIISGYDVKESPLLFHNLIFDFNSEHPHVTITSFEITKIYFGG